MLSIILHDTCIHHSNVYDVHINSCTRLFNFVAWPKYVGEVSSKQVPVPCVNSGVNVVDPSVCPYPIEMCMLGFPIHRNEIMYFITFFR